MKRTTKLVIALWAMFVALPALSQKGTEQQLEKEANSLFNKGEYLKAFPMYSQLVSLYPNKLEYNYKFGACAIYSEADKSKAIKFLSIATSKGVEDPMAWYYLGKAYHLNYQFRESIKSYETFLRTADPKLAAKTDAQREIETCIYGSNLLANIKDLTVINKTEADRESFFRYFNLEGIGGKILTLPDELRTSLDKKSKEPGIIHYPGNSTTIYFSSLGKDGKNGKDIYKAQILPDGKFSTPELLKGDVNTKYDEDYCFMHSDGKTLYFASKGHNSMGGYDIFKSELDQETGVFGPAINLDFAINTPDDDIFFLADSLNKRAYFASARTSDQNHLHVYNVMVESTPLQIIYLKGDYISEINPEQKRATMKISDQISGRVIMEGSTNPQTGGYVAYVPGAGEYNFKVITENSTKIHEVKVNIPAFDKPVALRQEMKLISEGGKDRLIVINYFDTPLNEDLASLASDMLRKKASLEVNATAEILAAEKKNNNDRTENIYSLEPTMKNAPLAAGFGDGTTVKGIAESLEKEAATIKSFVNESDKKYDNAYAYALKKQKEAEIALKQAEQLRNTTSTYTTQQDVDKLRQSVELTNRVKVLQREAQAAIAAAEAVKQYKETEAERSKALSERAALLRQAENEENFNDAVVILKTEYQRQSDMRSGDTSTPQAELIAKAKAKEAEQQKAEQKLTSLREDEKDLNTQLKIAENKKTTAKKKSEREKAETDYVNIKAALDGTSREIAQQITRTAKLSEEAKDLYANAAMYERLAVDTQMGLLSGEQQTLSETERTALTMKLSEQDNRINALDIKDPQMLALITDAGNSTESLATVRTQNVRPAITIASDHQALMMKADSPQAKNMFANESLHETNQAIAQLEAAKKQNALTPEQQKELTELTALRATLRSEIAANTAPQPNVRNEELRAVCTWVDPAFNARVEEINNSSGSEIDRTVRMMQYKKATLDKLKEARHQNARQAALETDATALNAMVERDRQYEVAISQLEKYTSDVSLYKAAYETENKAIIESDEMFAGKLQEQINISESYIDALTALEKEKLTELENTSDQQEAAAINQQLAAIKLEREAAEKKLDNYEKDLSLTSSTSGPKADSAKVAINTKGTEIASAATSLEDEIEKSESKWDFDSKIENEGDPQKTQAQIDTEKTQKIFKQREQSESIFSYESGIFEEIVAQHTTAETELKHRDKIQSINDEIFLVEAEMENVNSESKLRKLDYKAEQLYLRRSLIEIDNASAIATMAQREFEEEKKKADEMTAINREKIDSRMMISDYVDMLFRASNSNMQEAAELRQIAPSKQDDIERADFYREAFAKEALAIEQMMQVQQINENIDMLLNYDDQQLAMMRAGKSPDEELVAAMMQAEESKKETATETEAIKTEMSNTSSTNINIAEAEISKDNIVNTTGTNPWERDNTTFIKSSATSQLKDTNAGKAPATVTEPVSTQPTTKATAMQPTTIQPTATKPTNTQPTATKPIAPQPIAPPAAKGESLAVVNPVTPSRDAASAASSAYSAAEAENYYFSAPEILTKDLFVTTTRSVYSENKPIPLDMPMPKGVYYKVQIGAFRNSIPQNLFDEFAPVCGETMNNGIIRYTAGFFTTFESADKTKKDIRNMGYNDAFVVAFRDGKRIPLYEAMGKASSDFQASVEIEYIYGDKGTAPKSTLSPAAPTGPNNTSSNSNVGNNTANYYSKYPEAAKAEQVENIKGLFYTVQVGVYSRPVSSKYLGYINPLNSELLEGNRIRYTSGRFTNLQDAVDKRTEAKTLGIKDAFITAYYNSKRISISEADRLLKENGQSILATE